MKRIVVKFTDQFESDLVKRIVETEFVGMCELVKFVGDKRTVYCFPKDDEYRGLKSTLVELEAGGALSYSEEADNAS